jgi:hypothetical protein
MKGRRFKQTKSLEERLADEAKLLREQARLLPCGALREEEEPGRLRPDCARALGSALGLSAPN